MSALDKVLAAVGTPRTAAFTAPEEEPDYGVLIRAAGDLLDELAVLLASSNKPSSDKSTSTEGKGEGGGEDEDDDDDSDDDDRPPWLKKKTKKDKKGGSEGSTGKNVKASALVDLARIALAGVPIDWSPDYDWVEVTAAPSPYEVALAGGDVTKPYGDVPYADPGYRDGKARYPLDKAHVRAALSYFGQARNRAKYSAAQVKTMMGKIRSAASKSGISVSGDASDNEKVAATMLELAGSATVALAWPQKSGSGGASADHGSASHEPFNGRHSHGHMHNNDNIHGSKGSSSMGPGWSTQH